MASLLYIEINRIMKKIRNVILYLSLLFVGFLNAQSQTAFQHLKNNVENIIAFNKYLPQEKVYLHFDNTGYFKGETIWFKAYVVRTDKSCLSDLSHVLYLELVTPGGDVIETKKFCIKDGEADGYLKLDDKVLESGFYEVRAYTRYMTNWDNDCIFSRVFPIFETPIKNGDYSKIRIMRTNYRKRTPNIREKSDTMQMQVKKINARFYPEGGNLIQGLSSNIAFDISDGKGGHLDADVYLVDGKDTVARSHTEYEGRGVIDYDPSYSTYKVIVKDSDRHEEIFSLPHAIESGYVMNVDHENGNWIKLHIKSTPNYYGKIVSLVITHNGMVTAIDTMTIEKEGVAMKIQRKEMSDGVNQLTLLGSDGSIKADRMLFKYPDNDSDSICITIPDKKILPCKKISMDIKTKINFTFSLSVRDYATEINGCSQDAMTWMLLTSDLKGFIENPQYYLEKNDDKHRRATDLLMLVQGWRRYDLSVMTGEKKFEKQQPCENALYVDGKLYAKDKKVNVDGIPLTMSLYNQCGNVMQGETVSHNDGNYAVQVPDCEGDWTMLINSGQGKFPANCTVGINRHFSPKCRYISYLESQMSPIGKPSILMKDGEEKPSSILSMTEKTHALKEVNVKGHRVYDDARKVWENESVGLSTANLYYDCSKASDEIIDKGEEMPDFYDWIKNKNSFFSGFIQVNVDEGRDYERIYRSQSNKTNNETNGLTVEYHPIAGDANEALVSSNGKVYVANVDKVQNKNVNLINKIFDTGFKYKGRPVIWIMNNKFANITGLEDNVKIDDIINDVDFCIDGIPAGLDEIKSVCISEDENIWEHYILYEKLANNLPVTVFVYTYHEFARNVKGLRRTHFEGFAKSETFKMNDYSLMPPEADYRRTLYWNPNVTTDKDGKASIDFYNNSSCKQMFISAEGITKDGVPLVYRNK